MATAVVYSTSMVGSLGTIEVACLYRLETACICVCFRQSSGTDSLHTNCGIFELVAHSPSLTAQLAQVGFGEVDFSAVENSGGRFISVLKEGVNTDSLSVIVRVLTIEQFNNLTNRVLRPDLVNRTRDIDPAECKEKYWTFCDLNIKAEPMHTQILYQHMHTHMRMHTRTRTHTHTSGTADRQDFNASIEEVLFNPSNVREETQVFITYLDDGIDEAEEGFLVIVELGANTSPFDFLNEGVALMTITDDDGNHVIMCSGVGGVV